MKKRCWILVLGGLCLFAQAGSPPVAAQGSDRVSNFLRKALGQRSQEMAEAAAQMPADQYAFKAPPDDKTFGYLTLHVADGNYLFCALIGGVSPPPLQQLNESDPKQALVDRMKSSFDFCNTAVARLDDSHMGEVLNIGGAKMSRAMAVLTLTGSWATHYELQQKYLSLNGHATPAKN